MRKIFALGLFCLLGGCTETNAVASPEAATDGNITVEVEVDPEINVEAEISPSDGLISSASNIDNADSYSAFGDILARHQQMSARVARVSRALRVANAPLCDLTRADLGVSTHDLDDYPPPLHPLALHFLPIGEDGDYIRAVVPGSPADLAGVRAGDRIVSGWPLSEDRTLILDSGQALFDVKQPGEIACDIPTFVINDDRPNASTDGVEIDLSTALLSQVGDDSALAFIIAHEMAHVIRGHSRPGWAAELEADADALILMRNAGFDVVGTVDGWEAGVEIHRKSQAESPTHPPIRVRLANLQMALADLETKTAEFLVLPPPGSREFR